MTVFNEDWEHEAANWIAWAREPDFDSYWEYRDAFFTELVPPPRGRTLEVGCGEGRVTRDLKARGHDVVAIDASPTLLQAAQDADPAGEYLLADAAALPFDGASFDLVVAYNALMDIEDMSGAVAEAARVLERGGRFCISVTHPLVDAGRFGARDGDAPFVIEDSYFGRRRVDIPFERGGLSITFHGWAHPLEAYTRALAAAGFLIEALREPPIPDRSVDRDAADLRFKRFPLFLHLRALKP